MTEREVMIVNPTGLHARPAARLVSLCRTFSSRIVIIAYDNRSCDAKSILNVLQCCIRKGDRITVQADGSDEEEAVNAIAGLISSFIE